MSRFTIEAATGTRRVRWYALVALILVPVLLVGGVLLAVNDYTARLSHLTAAIVNDDDGAVIDGQTVPLGRQLSATLVEGATNDAGLDANYDWVLTDEADAASGLDDGSYAVVVRIPKDFSKNATSFADAATVTQATVAVESSERNRITDDTISTVIASAATRSFGRYLSTNYLENIYVGFNTLHDQLGEAADGAGQLADGAQKSADGTQQLADGADELADGTSQLSDGIGQLATGARQSANGAAQFADGVGQYTDGTAALADGLGQLADGTKALPKQVKALAAGSAGITSGVQGIAQIAAAQPDMTLAELDAFLTSQGGSLADLSAGAAQVSGGLTQFSKGLPQITEGIADSADGAEQLADNGSTLASGADDLAAGLGQLADGVDQTDSGADQLSGGVGDFADGVHQLADGSDQLADGATTLADGLDTAVDQLPTYTESERTRLADVVSSPIATESTGAVDPLARSFVPLLMAIALILGALATYLVVAPVSRRALTSRSSSVRLAFAGLLPGLIVGVVQGVAIAAAAQILLQLEVGPWFALAGVAALAGISLAAVVQGVVALFSNAGRLVIALVAAVALAAGIVSTAPALLLDLAALLPTAPASAALGAAATGSGYGSSIALLVFWAIAGFALALAAVLRQRAVSVRQLKNLAV